MYLHLDLVVRLVSMNLGPGLQDQNRPHTNDGSNKHRVNLAVALVVAASVVLPLLH